MKKTYTLIGFILASGFVFGQAGLQRPSNLIQTKNKVINTHITSQLPSIHEEGSGNRSILFQSDFSDASVWDINHEPGTTGDWVIGNAIPSGGFLIDPINSATFSNGIALFDSDLGCSGNQIANLEVADPIDCSTAATVQVRFSQYYRNFYDSTFVQVSTDGTNWTNYTINGQTAPNDFNDLDILENPSQVVVNISDVAANQSTVYVRFQFYSPSTLAGFPGCAYSWMIDDVVIETVPDYELKLNKYSYNNAYEQLAYDFEQTDGPYFQLPVNQCSPLKFTAIVSNTGLQTTDGVTVEVNITDYNGNTFGPYTSAPFSLNSFEQDTIFITSSFTPDETGTIVTTATVVYDANVENVNSNNIRTLNTEITDDVYALDRGLGFSSSGFNATVTDWVVWNYYEIQNDTYCTGLSFAIDAAVADEGALEGEVLFLNLLELAEDGTESEIYGIDENVYTIEATSFQPGGGNLNLLSYDFETPTLMEAGRTYIAQLYWIQDGVTLRLMNTGPSATNFNLQFIDGDDFLADNTVLRMNTSTTIGLKETSQSGNLILSQNQPNPVRDNTIISYELKNAEKVSLEIYDITGKLISTLNEGNKAAGNYTINYNASKLNAGIYTYTLVAGDARLTKKMTVVR